MTYVPATKAATELSHAELIEIYNTLDKQAFSSANMSIFELDTEDTFTSENATFCAITNFADRREIVANYEAIFSYSYFQSNVFPILFSKPYMPSENDYPMIWEQDGKIYFNNTSYGIPLSSPIETEHEVIEQTEDSFSIRALQELLIAGGDTTFQTYVVRIVNQGGIWVLDNYYWFDVLIHRN